MFESCNKTCFVSFRLHFFAKLFILGSIIIHQPQHNSSRDLVTLQLTQDQAEKVYDALSYNVNNRMLSGMGPSSNMNRKRRKNRKSKVLTVIVKP